MEHDTAEHRDTPVIACPPDLVLRPVGPDDAEPLYAAIRRNWLLLREWLPWLVPGYSMRDMWAFLQENCRANEARAGLTSLICDGDEILGGISLHRFDIQNRATSIGYWLDAQHQGKGIMTRACRGMVNAAFREYGLHRVEIRCATENRRSAGIPRRLGFREEGVLREAEWLYDRWVDLRVFSMLEQDWK